MAFTPATCVHVGGDSSGIAPRLWLYKTADNITDLDGSNYWASGATVPQKLAADDIVLAICADGTCIATISAVTSTTSTAAIMTA